MASHLSACSRSLRTAGERLDQESETSFGGYFTAAAEQLERLERRVSESELSELVGDLQQTIRKRPELAYGACFLAGLVIARFLKASKPGPKRGTSARSGSMNNERVASEGRMPQRAGAMGSRNSLGGEMDYVESDSSRTPTGAFNIERTGNTPSFAVESDEPNNSARGQF